MILIIHVSVITGVSLIPSHIYLQTKKIPDGPNNPSLAIWIIVPMSTAVITTAYSPVAIDAM